MVDDIIFYSINIILICFSIQMITRSPSTIFKKWVGYTCVFVLIGFISAGAFFKGYNSGMKKVIEQIEPFLKQHKGFEHDTSDKKDIQI